MKRIRGMLWHGSIKVSKQILILYSRKIDIVMEEALHIANNNKIVNVCGITNKIGQAKRVSILHKCCNI